MKLKGFIMAAAMMLLSSCSAKPAWVKVEGNKYIGQDGKELIFRGLCYSDPVKSTVVYGEHITKYFEEKGISFTVWCFDTSWAPTLIKDWNFTPTTQGVYFKEYLQKNSTRR